jgi:hypothetical protein
MRGDYIVSRRDFRMLIGAGFVTWQRPVCAQQRTSPVVGYLHIGSQAGGRFLEA